MSSFIIPEDALLRMPLWDIPALGETMSEQHLCGYLHELLNAMAPLALSIRELVEGEQVTSQVTLPLLELLWQGLWEGQRLVQAWHAQYAPRPTLPTEQGA